MKVTNLSFLLGGLMFAGLAQAQDQVQIKAEAAILKSCAGCHDQSMTPAFVDDQGNLLSEDIKLFAKRIEARVLSTTRPMPPKSAPAFMQLTAETKADILAYTKQLAGGGTVEPVNPDAIVPLSKLTVEDGFKIEVFAQARGARSLAVHSSGVVFVGTGGFSDVDPNGRVHAIVPTDSGNKVVAFVSGRSNPNGVALHGNDLYVAELSRIVVYKNAIATARALAAGTVVRPQAVVVKGDFRRQSNHSWKYITIGPDEKIYVGVGADCNVCQETEAGASIFRLNLDGTGYEKVAAGVRNTVGMAFHPVTEELWFTDNGRDSLGDNFPGDELNRVSTTGQHFGFPHCFASNVTDPTFGKTVDCNGGDFTKPVVDLGPHVASLGMTFYTGGKFPAKYDNAIFIAEHGSWNSSKKVGYKLSIVEEKVNATTGAKSYTYRPFVSGFVDAAGKTNWGRPVDVKNYIDGSLLLSDDNAGIVYRISPK